MRKHLFYLLLCCVWCLTPGCKQQNREEAQQQFRQRQQALRERESGPQPSAAPTQSPVEIPASPVETPAADAPAKPASAVGDKVIGVKDGDTIVLLRNGEEVTVRLFGVDTPEKAQDYGQKARQFTSDLVFGKTVRLIVHNTDRYGRTVGTILLPDGRSLNEELVRNGFAWHYKAYSNDTKLANLEFDARLFKRGLWRDPNPVPPWEYRIEKRSGSSAASKAAAAATASLPAGAAKRTVYLCNSTGSGVYHLTRSCYVLQRCNEQVLAVTEAVAIREYDRRADKTCSKP